MRRHRFLVAATSAMLGYCVMNLLIPATPLAMLDRGLGFGETATVIQWHVLAMFAPSLMTGHLIERFGAVKIIMTGAEKATAQGLNDFLVFGMVTVTALGPGALHHAFG